MTQFNFADIASALKESKETGVSFEGRLEKWGTAEAVKSLIEEIDKCEQLIFLNLDGNTLGVEAAACIGEALKKHPEFKKALWKNMFTGRMKEEIPKALDHLGKGMIAAGVQLNVFDCSDNALGPNGMTGLVELLGSSVCYSLQELRLNNCGLGIGGGQMLANALMKCHKDSVAAGRPFQLKVFIAGRNRLENEGAKALAKVFATLKSLEEVAMPQNGIYLDGIMALAEAFKLNENMRVLDLNDNTIKPKGATALANVLHCMPKLREIHFAEALVKTQGALVLADALQDNHVELEVLNLGYNEIRSDGGYAIVAALQNKKLIKNVLLNGNQFGDECCDKIKERFESNPDALGSLLEDEGEDDDEDEEDDENGSEDEETDVSRENGEEVSENYGASDDENYTGEEDDIEGVNYVTALSQRSLDVSNNDQSFISNKSVSFVGEESRPNTVETFCQTPNPTAKLLSDIEETDKLEAFRNYLNTFKDEDYLLMLVFTTLKCAALAKESTEALDIAIELFKDTFEHAVNTRQVTRVKNFFLIQLGLLKCEDKDFRPVYNLQSCRYALKETIAKNTSIADDIKTTFNLFLERFA